MAAAGKKDDVVLLNFWLSPFGMRVRIALAEKGVEYEYREEDIRNKGELLLRMNPVHQKIPVLIHNGKPICESTIIVQYIDEVWNGNDKPTLLPSDPYERAQARFWADYIDKKVYPAVRKIYTSRGAEREAGKEEFLEIFKQLEENPLGKNPYFGGAEFGFLDLVLVPFYSWFYCTETIAGFKIEDTCPKIISWGKRCMERESVAKTLLDSQKMHELLVEFYNIDG